MERSCLNLSFGTIGCLNNHWFGHNKVLKNKPTLEHAGNKISLQLLRTLRLITHQHCAMLKRNLLISVLTAEKWNKLVLQLKSNMYFHRRMFFLQTFKSLSILCQRCKSSPCTSQFLLIKLKSLQGQKHKTWLKNVNRRCHNKIWMFFWNLL